MNRSSRQVARVLGALACLMAAAALGFSARAQQRIPVSAIERQTHIHGLAVDRQDPSYLFIATHHGLFRAGPDGLAEQLSIVQDFMGFQPHPTVAGLLFASGHPAAGGNLGFIVSTDGGKTWVRRSLGLNGPVDFHQMAVSPADPNVIYGAFGLLQVSRNGGTTWSVAGPLPGQVIDLAASAIDPNRLYAAAVDGLFVSIDAGRSWTPLIAGAPVSLVEVAPDGSLYAFVLEQGLLRAPAEGAALTRVPGDWVRPYLLHLAVDPSNPNRMFAATQTGQIVASVDQGRTWTHFGE